MTTKSTFTGDSFFERMTLDELEKWAILAAMERNKSNIRAVAKELGAGKNTIYRKIARYNRERRETA